MSDRVARQQFVDGSAYPPVRTGLRGSHAGSFEVAHQIRDGRRFDIEDVPVTDEVDFVVAGAGISGLATAWFYRQRDPDATILILDNHDDFGGHAKRNEFHIGGRLLLGYGGSEAMQSPDALYGSEAKALLAALGVDYHRFEQYFDTEALDVAGAPVRIRLRSTAVHEGDGVRVTYVRDGASACVRARRATLAGYHMMIPSIMPELPLEQERALRGNVKAPLSYTKVVVRNWRPWVALGVHEVTSPMGFFSRLKLDYPVSIGDYRFPSSPDEPMVLHLVHVPTVPNRGLSVREARRQARQILYDTSLPTSSSTCMTSSLACWERAASTRTRTSWRSP